MTLRPKVIIFPSRFLEIARTLYIHVLFSLPTRRAVTQPITWACLIELSCLLLFFFLFPADTLIFASPYPVAFLFMLPFFHLLLPSPQASGVTGQAESIGREIKTPQSVSPPLSTALCLQSHLHGLVIHLPGHCLAMPFSLCPR